MGNQSSKPKAKNTKEHQRKEQGVAGFTKFQEFPLEIRLEIWRATLEPRIVDFLWNHTYSKQHFRKLRELCSAPSLKPDVYHVQPNIREVVRTEVRSPAILGVCRESRDEALRRYIPLRHCSLTRCYPYFDPGVDTVFFNALSFDMHCKCCADLTDATMAFSKTMMEQIWSKVQILAIHHTILETFCSSGALYACKNLKEVIVVPKERSWPECYKDWKRNPVEAERLAGLVDPYLAGQRIWAAKIETRVDVARDNLRERHPDWIEPGFRVKYWTRSHRTVFDVPEGGNGYEIVRVQVTEVDGSISGDAAAAVVVEIEPSNSSHALTKVLLKIVRRPKPGTTPWR